MNWIAIAGLAIGILSILIGHVMSDGSVGVLFQPSALVIVLGGTIGAVLVQSNARDLIGAVRQLKNVFVHVDSDLEELTERINLWSSTAKRQGTLQLEQYLENETDIFIQRSLRLLIDGIPSKAIQEILKTDQKTHEEKVHSAIKIWDAAGGYSPTIGVLAAVLGLIHIMANLAEPSELGAGIALAFVATLYGVGFANLIFIPIAHKLKAVNRSNAARCAMLIDAIDSISTGEHTIVITERLASHQTTR